MFLKFVELDANKFQRFFLKEDLITVSVIIVGNGIGDTNSKPG